MAPSGKKILFPGAQNSGASAVRALAVRGRPVASLIIRGLLPSERDAVNKLARKHRTTQAKFLRNLVRKAIGSSAETVRQKPTLTEEIARTWRIPGQEGGQAIATARERALAATGEVAERRRAARERYDAAEPRDGGEAERDG